MLQLVPLALIATIISYMKAQTAVSWQYINKEAVVYTYLVIGGTAVALPRTCCTSC